MLSGLKSLPPKIHFGWVFLCLAMIVFSGCSLLGDSATKKLTGGVNVTNKKYVSASVSGPSRIYVQDFSLDASDLKTDSGVGGLTDQVSGSGGILGRFSQRTSRGSISGNAEAQTPQIISAMSESLVAAFRKKGVTAERLTSGNGGMASDGWLVKGRFVGIDEGNRAQRAALGFGLGATQMVVQVSVSDLTGKNPNEPFLVFGTSKEAGMKPGGFNPYVIAAKFRMEKKATLDDIQKSADEIAGEILKGRDTLK